MCPAAKIGCGVYLFYNKKRRASALRFLFSFAFAAQRELVVF